MSGVFMDGGGGQNNVGHGIQMGNGGDGFLHGHDHGSVVPGQNGDGGFVNNLLGFNQHHGQSFISHLLGLDQPQQGHAQHVQQGQAPSQTAIWNMAWGSLKPANLLHGITISANVWWLILFLGYISWLFVLYWIRHHDPFTDATIGTRAPQTATSSYDRRVIDHCRGATPVKTSQSGGLGSVFVPIPRNAGQAMPANQAFGQPGAATGNGAATGSDFNAPMPQTAQVLPSGNYAAAAAAQPPAQSKFYQPYPAQPAAFGVPGSYTAPVQNYSYPYARTQPLAPAPAAAPLSPAPQTFAQPAIQAPLLHNQALSTSPPTAAAAAAAGSSMLLDSSARLRTIVNR
ncbi:MAG TPA: hypothetical protein V6C72_19660 [Chroococcales cyanobacterium]